MPTTTVARMARQRGGRVDREPGTDHPGARWRAVLGRDPGADGTFVYAVTTTGVYCRPTCPSRRPALSHVRFFAGADEAERAGFRACRRCDPRRVGPSPVALAVESAARYLASHLDERVTLARLAQVAGVSPFHLQRTFTRVIGVSPREYASLVRLDRLKDSLKGGSSVTNATYEAGYGSSSRVYEQADRRLGMTPGSYRSGAAGIEIRYAVVSSSVGPVLVGATDRGVCAVSMGDRSRPLEAWLKEEYPHATIRRDDEAIGAWARAVVARIERGDDTGHVPIDVPATAFQRRVWKALQDIPPGRTRSYRDVAAAIGQPKAVRAVAQACAANPVAVVVPCHRVVRSDGALGGYRWGVERKRQLLDRETGIPDP